MNWVDPSGLYSAVQPHTVELGPVLEGALGYLAKAALGAAEATSLVLSVALLAGDEPIAEVAPGPLPPYIGDMIRRFLGAAGATCFLAEKAAEGEAPEGGGWTVGEQIADGHGADHRDEFPDVDSLEDLADLVDGIVLNPDDKKTVEERPDRLLERRRNRGGYRSQLVPRGNRLPT